MKTKPFNKKLSLNKSTISNLDNGDMKKMHGGADNSIPRVCTTNGGTLCTYPCTPILATFECFCGA